MSQQSENRVFRGAVIAVVASMAIVPMTFYGCGPEWARWDASQANMYFRQGETEDALYQLRDAIRKSPRDPVVRLTLANRLIDLDQNNEALDIADDVLSVYPDNVRAMQTKAKAQQQLGDFEAALETQLELDQQLTTYSRGAQSRNELAYYRALAGRDLDLAKEDIEKAIETTNQFISWSGDTHLTLDVKATVLASMVARCCGQREKAIEILSRQIVDQLASVEERKKLLSSLVYEMSVDDSHVQASTSMFRIREHLRSHESRAATLMSCRALLYQDLELTNECRADRLHVDRLGFDSSEIVANLTSETLALNYLGPASAFLDTRGYVGSLLPWGDDSRSLTDQQREFMSSYADTIRDLDIAIFCIETNRESFDCFLRNSIELSGDKAAIIESLEKQSAILLYHRMLAHQRGGNNKLAMKDEKSIRDLGETPGPHLF